MGFSSTMMSAFGTGMSAGGTYGRAKSQQQMLDAEADLANIQAQQALEAGATAEQNSRLRTGAVYSEQRANMAANGVDLGTGSATDLLTSTKYLGERDALTIRDNATRTAWSYRAGAAVDRSVAGDISPGMDAFTSLLGGSTSVADSWYRWQQGGGRMPTWAGG